jgi:hypothetical protein
VVEPDQPPPAEYGGPAILSRGGVSSLTSPQKSIRFRPFLSLTASYDTGITPVVLNTNGKIPDDASIGGDAEAGLLGFHRFKTASLGLDYRGSYHHYAKNSYYNGSDQSLSLVYSKQATRRLQFTLREAAGILNRSFTANGEIQLLDPAFLNVPNNELFDGRTLYLNTAGNLTYQKTARLSFNFGADGFLIRRRSSALYGVTGYRARSDFAYRLTRYATMGAAYEFTHFEYTKGFGATDVHTIQLVESFRLGRRWELAMALGGARVETLGLTRVTIDPVIAEILGRNVGVEAVYHLNWVPSASANLTRKFRRAALTFGYSNGVTPGNGLYLTSRQQGATASFTYSGIRRVNIGVDGGYSSLGSLGQALGKYTGYIGGGGLTYNLTKSVHFITRYDYRHYGVDQTTFNRDSYRASMGFGFSPGDVPLSLW